MTLHVQIPHIYKQYSPVKYRNTYPVKQAHIEVLFCTLLCKFVKSVRVFLASLCSLLALASLAIIMLLLCLILIPSGNCVLFGTYDPMTHCKKAGLLFPFYSGLLNFLGTFTMRHKSSSLTE